MNYLFSLIFSLTTVVVTAQNHNIPLAPKDNFPTILEDQGWIIGIANYSNLKEIKRYKKFELGIQVPQNINAQIFNFLYTQRSNDKNLNPFMEWDVDIEAHFIHQESKSFHHVDAFFYRDYKVNESTDDWDDQETKYNFRTRFAPPKNGIWSANIICKIKGIEVFVSDFFEFNVIESGDPGYVSVHPNRKNLMRGGEMIYPVGHNFAGPNEHNIEWGGGGTDDYLGNNLYSNKNSTKATNTKEWASHIEKVETYLKQGGKFVRSIESPWATLIEYEKRGNYYDRLHYAWQQDKLMDLYDQYDALVLFNLLMHTSLTVTDGYYMFQWDWEKWEIWGKDTIYNANGDMPVYCYNPFPKQKGGKMPHETFLDEEDLKYHEQRTRYYISRYGYSTKIFEFELLSEPFNVNSNAFNKSHPYFENNTPQQKELFEAIENYHRRISTFIKENMQHTNQLIGVDYAMGSWNPYEEAVRIDKSYALPHVDIIGVNFYSKDASKYVISKSNENNSFAMNENSKAKAINDFQRWSTKPVILSEFGDGDNSQHCSEFKMLPVDALSAGFIGASGHLLWDGRLWREKHLWNSTILMEKLMNSKELISTLSIGNGDWTQGRQQARISNKKGESNVLELQYYLSKNQTQSVGYVRNRSYNVYTNRIDENPGCHLNLTAGTSIAQLTNIKWDDPIRKNRLRIEGVNRKTNYQVEWYSPTTNTLIQSDCVKSSKKDLVLKFPTLDVTTKGKELPAVYFIIKQTACN